VQHVVLFVTHEGR